jgi:hypothetical protein
MEQTDPEYVSSLKFCKENNIEVVALMMANDMVRIRKLTERYQSVTKLALKAIREKWTEQQFHEHLEKLTRG